LPKEYAKTWKAENWRYKMKENELTLELGLGVPIADASDMAINLAKQKKADVLFVYNKVKIKVSPSTTREHVINSFFSQAACLPDMGMQQKKMGM
ncbi:MAG: hypothetical protein IKZ64_00650, partial [Alphaproteobacteria bacterium]|nr:hypothetical protein [Alphaproteobacteria bacterium]